MTTCCITICQNKNIWGYLSIKTSLKPIKYSIKHWVLYWYPHLYMWWFPQSTVTYRVQVLWCQPSPTPLLARQAGCCTVSWRWSAVKSLLPLFPRGSSAAVTPQTQSGHIHTLQCVSKSLTPDPPTSQPGPRRLHGWYTQFSRKQIPIVFLLVDALGLNPSWGL